MMFDDDVTNVNTSAGQYIIQDGCFTSANDSSVSNSNDLVPSTQPNRTTPSLTTNNNNSNSAYNLFQAINPRDINRNYAATTTNDTNSSFAHLSSSNHHHNPVKSSNQRPTTVCLPSSGTSAAKTAYVNTSSSSTVQQNPIKRGKFSHNTTNQQQQQSSNCLFRIKQEANAINSDGESIVSNESDSNSSTFR